MEITIIIIIHFHCMFTMKGNHKTLLYELQTGISGTALDWFQSYLTCCTEAVCVEGEYSHPVTLQYGVPQGLVLGPLLYTIYTLPLDDILRKAGVTYLSYADDTQLYFAFDFPDTSSQVESLNKMQICVPRIKSCMTSSKLMLNDKKTKVVGISSNFFQDQKNLHHPICC